jgi:hypothetical protein
LGQVSAEGSAWHSDGMVYHSPRAVGTGHAESEFIGGVIEMKKLRSLLQHRIVLTTGRALLAFIAVAMIADLLLRAMGLVQCASPHTWLLDVQQNLGADGAAGAAGAAAASGGFNPNDKDVDPDPSPFKWFGVGDPTSSPGQGTPAGGGGGDGGKGGGGGDPPGGLGTGTDIAQHTWIHSVIEFIAAAAGEVGEFFGPAATMAAGAEQMEKGSQEIEDSHGATGGTSQSGEILTNDGLNDGSYNYGSGSGNVGAAAPN